MREIKFRFWVKSSNEMLYDIFMMCPVNTCIQYADQGWFVNQTNYHEEEKRERIAQGEVLRDEYIALQFTGLKDKKGNEIYEGDIVSILDLTNRPKPYIGVVKWNENVTGFESHCKELSFPQFLHNDKPFEDAIPELKRFTGNGSHRSIEVIGNIYEHPSLLEG